MVDGFSEWQAWLVTAAVIVGAAGIGVLVGIMAFLVWTV